jgi:sec-independent protein translocase protein TatB
MFFGLTIEKLLLIGVIAAFVVGPERLPRYAEALARATRRVRDYLQNAKTRVKDEMGEDFDDIDWRTLDPRQYDPRRIIREALLDDPPIATVKAAGTAAAVTSPLAPPEPPRRLGAGETPPFDAEAT